jgi:putative Holliday junction resolvase
MRYLAIDYGKKRIGLAICDASEMIASPLTVIDGGKDPIKRIVEIVTQEGVGAIVVGMPLNMDDSQGSQAKVTIEFAQRLKKHIDIEILFQDERLSSFAAEEKMAPAEFSRKKKRKHLDAVAAAQILETFLENRHAGSQ